MQTASRAPCEVTAGGASGLTIAARVIAAATVALPFGVAFEALTIARLASLTASTGDLERRRLLLGEFLDEHSQESLLGRRALLADEPGGTGNRRWDALLAGLAEHLARRDGVEVPEWVDEPSRFLAEPWCCFDLPFFRADAELETPPAFRRHGVLIRAVELERA